MNNIILLHFDGTIHNDIMTVVHDNTLSVVLLNFLYSSSSLVTNAAALEAAPVVLHASFV